MALQLRKGSARRAHLLKDAGVYTDSANAVHLLGFSGEQVPISPTAGTWLELIGSRAQKFSLQAQFGRSINDNMQLVTRATSLRVGGVTIVVRLALSTASQQWEVTAAANGKVINGSSATLAGGITVRVAKFNPPSHQVSSRVTINAGFVKLVTTQRFDSKAGKPNDNFNFVLTLVGPLKPPVSGTLSTSYNAVF
ncbi:hypothetical protein ABPG77_009797 [Micractinium sp. CCAP 211/92]